MATIVKKGLSWTSWLLILVYFGGLAAISGFVGRSIEVNPTLSYYEAFIHVTISTFILFVLAQIYIFLRDKNPNSVWWGRGLLILSGIFGFIGVIYLVLGLVQLASINDYNNNAAFQKLEASEQESIIQTSYFFGGLLMFSSAVAFASTIGLKYRRKFGWYAAVTLVLMQIVAVTGLLDNERAKLFILPTWVRAGLTEEQIQHIEFVFVPALVSTMFAMLVANIVLITFLTLPRILAIFGMPTNILSSRVTKGH